MKRSCFLSCRCQNHRLRGLPSSMITLNEQEHLVSGFDEVFQDHQLRVQTAHQEEEET